MSKYLFLTLLLATSPTLADFTTTYQVGDYATAFQEIAPLAEKGDAKAQTYLGTMYLEGKGISQNYQEARKWFFLAAKQGVAESQLGMGVIYATGKGVPQDLVKAYAWLSLAAAQNHVEATTLRDMIIKNRWLTPVQLRRAQALAKEWQSNLGGISFEVFKQIPESSISDKVGQGFVEIGRSILEPLSEELTKILLKGTHLEQTFKQMQELKTQKEAIEHGEKPLEDCIGADNEVNQTVLNCMRGK